MGILEKMSETISSTGRDVANKARSVADIAKIKHQIFSEEEKLKDIFAELGRKYYKDNGSNPEEKYAHLCNEAYTCKSQIEKLKQQIYAMKGIKVCEKCGAEVDEEFLFCGVCGAKLPESVVEILASENCCEDEDNFNDETIKDSE